MIANVFTVVANMLGRRQSKSPAHADIGTAYLKYDSIEDWMVGENIPMGFIKEPDPVLRDHYIDQYGALRRHLYAKHVAMLLPKEQRAILNSCHPSQSHRFAKEAEPYCRLLLEHLKSLGAEVARVELGWYHMDRIVLTVITPEQLDKDRLRELPWLFRGFEIKYMNQSSDQPISK
ncbi:hypothetical protein GC197_07960 [bacterium]|nr:hypothetical protein [bacterium]